MSSVPTSKLTYLQKYADSKDAKRKRKKKKGNKSEKEKLGTVRIDDADDYETLGPDDQDALKRLQYGNPRDEDEAVVLSSRDFLSVSPVRSDGCHVSNHMRQRRYDSCDEGDKTAHQNRRIRRDSSSSNEVTSKSHKGGYTRKRYDSDELSGSVSQSGRKRRFDSFDSESSVDHLSTRERMSSGHTAGLQSGSMFAKTEKKLVTKKLLEVQQMTDKFGHRDTVYRDKATGKKLDEPAAASVDSKEVYEQKQILLNTGKVQLERVLQAQEERHAIEQSQFARTVDNDALEESRKNVIREGDPMATQVRGKLRPTPKSNLGVPTKPVYKGPPAKPNRFGILPGYRWDGVDRGNGFEDKLIAENFKKTTQDEENYRWRTADM